MFQLFCPQISFCPDVPIWGPYGSHMVYMDTIWVPYGSHMVYVGPIWVPYGSHMAPYGETQMGPRWAPWCKWNMDTRWGIWAPSGAHVCPSGSHMGSPYGNHMVGEFCPDGNQMGPIFFATWVRGHWSATN